MCFERRPDARRAHALPLAENLNSLRFRETDRSVHATHNGFSPEKFQRFEQIRSLSFPGYTQPKCWKYIANFDLLLSRKSLQEIMNWPGNKVCQIAEPLLKITQQVNRVLRFHDTLLKVLVINLQVFVNNKKLIQLKDIAKHAKAVTSELDHTGHTITR
jgi:hypothetical protein